MSAAEEVDGLGVVRPHYGCECPGLGMRGRGARLGFSRGLSRAGARGGLGPHGPGRATQMCGWQQGSRPIPLELRRRRVGTWRPQPEPGVAAGEPHPAPPPFSSTEIGKTAWGEVAGGLCRACPGHWTQGFCSGVVGKCCAAPIAACEGDPGYRHARSD